MCKVRDPFLVAEAESRISSEEPAATFFNSNFESIIKRGVNKVGNKDSMIRRQGL